MTLPLVYTIKKANSQEKSKIENMFGKDGFKGEEVNSILRLIEKYGGVEYTKEVAKRYAEKAKDELSVVEPTPYREALVSLADYVFKRRS